MHACIDLDHVFSHFRPDRPRDEVAAIAKTVAEVQSGGGALTHEWFTPDSGTSALPSYSKAILKSVLHIFSYLHDTSLPINAMLRVGGWLLYE